jgi:Fe-S-cluster containining protein
VLRTPGREETAVTEQTPIPCFRCGICCARYQPPLTTDDIGNIASALGISRSKLVSGYAVKVPTKEGYLLKHADNGCIFLAWGGDGKARCSIYTSRPRACREWRASLSKPECLEGLAKLKSQGQMMLPEELFSSDKEQEEPYRALKSVPPQR